MLFVMELVLSEDQPPLVIVDVDNTILPKVFSSISSKNVAAMMFPLFGALLIGFMRITVGGSVSMV